MQEPTLSKDQPKNNPWVHDKLGYAPFAQRLSKSILNLSSNDGFVIGISGSWGSGKTTVINFTKAYLNKHNQEAASDQDKITVIDFSPWLYSGRSDLIAEYFKVLRVNILNKHSGNNRRKQFGQFLLTNSESISSAVTALGVALDPTGGIVAATGAKIATKSTEKAMSKWLDEPSLQEAYIQLVGELKAAKNSILVVIDDLDRLDADETIQMLQMVKSVGQLPYVTYLLSYDRDILEGILTKNRDDKANLPSYLEKIIQQEIALPQPSKIGLLQMLDQEAKFILDQVENDEHWRTIVTNGIRRWLRKPRDVFRYSNSLKFVWPALDGEIDPADILAMEGLRLFNNRAFLWIQENYDFLFSKGRFVLSADKTLEERGKQFRDSIDTEQHHETINLVCALFPSRAEHLAGNNHHIAQPYYKTAIRRGIGTEACYDAYFSLHVPSNAISKSTINEILNNLDDAAVLKSIFRGWLNKKDVNGASLLGELLVEIRYRFIQPRSIEPSSALLSAIFHLGDELYVLGWGSGMFETPAFQTAINLIDDMLEVWGKRTSGEELIKALSENHSVSFASGFFLRFHREQEAAKSKEKSIHSRISKTALTKFGKLLDTNIEEDCQSGAINTASNLSAVIAARGHFRGFVNTKHWVAVSAKSNVEFLERSIAMFITTSRSTHGTEYEFTNSTDAKLCDLASLLDSAKEALKTNVLNDANKDKFQIFATGATKWLEGNANSDISNSMTMNTKG